MRLLLFTILFPFTLFAQVGEELTAHYVWAKSGLTMRAEGKAGAEKIAVIPFGGEVTYLGDSGYPVKVTALKSIEFQGHDGPKKSDAYVMENSYVKVEYGDETGYVFAGYLSELNPLAEDGEPYPSLEAWLAAQAGEPRAIDITGQQEFGSRTINQYSNGITTRREQFEGGGSHTVIIPSGTINDGFLMVANWYGVTEPVGKPQKWFEDADFLPELLEVQEDGSLIFTGDMSRTVISVVHGMLIIHSEGGC